MGPVPKSSNLAEGLPGGGRSAHCRTQTQDKATARTRGKKVRKQLRTLKGGRRKVMAPEEENGETCRNDYWGGNHRSRPSARVQGQAPKKKKNKIWVPPSRTRRKGEGRGGPCLNLLETGKEREATLFNSSLKKMDCANRASRDTGKKKHYER